LLACPGWALPQLHPLAAHDAIEKMKLIYFPTSRMRVVRAGGLDIISQWHDRRNTRPAEISPSKSAGWPPSDSLDFLESRRVR